MDSTPSPNWRAIRGPVGDATAATATSKSEYGRIWVRASTRVYRSVLIDTVSPASNRLRTSTSSSSALRCCSGSMPIM